MSFIAATFFFLITYPKIKHCFHAVQSRYHALSFQTRNHLLWLNQDRGSCPSSLSSASVSLLDTCCFTSSFFSFPCFTFFLDHFIFFPVLPFLTPFLWSIITHETYVWLTCSYVLSLLEATNWRRMEEQVEFTRLDSHAGWDRNPGLRERRTDLAVDPVGGDSGGLV